jgi:hypothetical protein
MIDHQIDEGMILRDEVSDEALEAAALAAFGGFPTLPHIYGLLVRPVRCEAIQPRPRHAFDATNPQSRRLLDWMSQTSVHCMNKVARCKIGAGSPRESPAPISVSPSPKMPDIGRGRHFFNKLWLTVGSVLRPKKLFLWMPRNEAKLFGQSCRRDNYQK